MTLEEHINKDYITAMKAKDKERAAVINFLRASIKQIKVDTRVDNLDDAAVISIIKKQVKQREDSIKQYAEGGRPELADKEQAELNVLQEYLPEEMPQEAVEALVDEIIKETGASTMKEMGAVMKMTLDKAAGQADGKMVSDIVKAKLSQ